MSELPEPVKSQMAAMMALRDLEVERQRADKMREDSNTLYELRGWLRLCGDNPAGHAEFYQWACHYIFGDEPPWVNRCCRYGCDCGECYSRSPDDESSHHCEATI